jgi:hypothetical protein
MTWPQAKIAAKATGVTTQSRYIIGFDIVVYDMVKHLYGSPRFKLFHKLLIP